MKRVRLLAIPLLAVLLGIAFLLPLSASAATKDASAAHTSSAGGNPLNNIPISGTVSNTAGQTVGTFTGTLHVQQFAAQNGGVVASGKLSGILTTTSGTQAVKNVKVASIPVALDPSCSVLSLTLGPIHLNLLGLVVDVNQIVVNITAQPGTLLGGLLCQLAGATTLQQIVSLLNQILAAL